MRATIVDTGCSAITMVDQRVCGSVRGGVEMTEEDSTAVKGAGSALLGMGTSAQKQHGEVKTLPTRAAPPLHAVPNVSWRQDRTWEGSGLGILCTYAIRVGDTLIRGSLVSLHTAGDRCG